MRYYKLFIRMNGSEEWDSSPAWVFFSKEEAEDYAHQFCRAAAIAPNRKEVQVEQWEVRESDTPFPDDPAPAGKQVV